jgi:hypothetical protein
MGWSSEGSAFLAPKSGFFANDTLKIERADFRDTAPCVNDERGF